MKDRHRRRYKGRAQMGTEEETAAAIEAVKLLAVPRRRFLWLLLPGAGRWMAVAEYEQMN